MKKLFATSGVKGVLIWVILLLTIAAIFWRPILVLYHQQQAGKIIDQVASTIEGSDLISYRCFLGQLLDEPPTEMDEAIKHLSTAKDLQKHNAQSAYLLGQAYCLNNEFEHAIDYLKDAQILNENNPNLFIEEGFASLAIANFKFYENNFENKNSLVESITNAKSNLKKGKINFNLISQAANGLFAKGQFKPAYLLYWLAEEYQPLTDIEKFRIFLISKILDQVFPKPIPYYNLPVLIVGEELIITPDDIYRLDQARKVTKREVDELTFGLVVSRRSDAVMLVEFSESGEYTMKIQIIDRPPAPTRLQLSVDFQSVLEIELPNGDDQLKTFEVETTISEGVHLLSVKLLNDAIINGEDRNGYINQIIIIKN